MQNPNPVTAAELATRTGKDAGEFTDALAGIDQDALFTAEREALVAGVWDQASTVNGVDAATVLASLQVPTGGAVVTIGGTDGSVMVLQPFDPGTPGVVAIAPQDAQAVADRMADQIATDRARGKALAQLPAELTSGTPNTPAPSGVDLTPLTEQLAAQAEQLAAQQESIDWLAGVVIDLATGEDVTA